MKSASHNRDDLKGVGDYIRARRLEKELSLEKLMQVSGVHMATIGRWENGETMPGLLPFDRVCECLDLSMEEVLYMARRTTENTDEK